MNDRARDAVLGALTADAAALGLHWIYDPVRIAEVAGDAPEFMEPDLRHYKGVPAYFAHGGKRAGDPTHYGEQLLVMLRSLQATDWKLSCVDYERRFVETFGPGGTFVGYIDHPTRDTLRNADAAERAALDALDTVNAVDIGDADRNLLQAAVTANGRRWRGEPLARAVDSAVRIKHGDDEALLAAGRAMARAFDETRAGPHGADDMQLPAVSKLPALAVASAFDVEAAIRVTNDNDEAVRYGQQVARAIRTAVDGGTPREAAAQLEAGKTGLACPLDQAVPLIRELLLDTSDFVSAVRANILAGGDSAGRGIVLGAIFGACSGVPEEWTKRLRSLPALPGPRQRG